ARHASAPRPSPRGDGRLLGGKAGGEWTGRSASAARSRIDSRRAGSRGSTSARPSSWARRRSPSRAARLVTSRPSVVPTRRLTPASQRRRSRPEPDDFAPGYVDAGSDGLAEAAHALPLRLERLRALEQK